MSEYLSKMKSEVMDVILTEYDEKTLLEGIRAEGREEGKLEQLIDLVKKGLLKVTDAAKEAGKSEEEFILLLK